MIQFQCSYKVETGQLDLGSGIARDELVVGSRASKRKEEGIRTTAQVPGGTRRRPIVKLPQNRENCQAQDKTPAPTGREGLVFCHQGEFGPSTLVYEWKEG